MKYLPIILTLFSFDVFSQGWSSLGNGVSQSVTSLYADHANNVVYAGGYFYYADTLRVNGIAAWDGNKWSSLGNGAVHHWWISAITKYKNEIYSDGEFTNNRDNIGGKFNGVTWDSLNHGVGSKINCFKEINNELYLGGTFLTVNGDSCNLTGKWDGTNWTCLNSPYPNYEVSAIEYYNGLVYLGGNFDNNVKSIDIASWDGSNFSIVGSGITGTFSGVDAMAVYHNELYVGGYFLKADGNTANHIMKWNGVSWSEVGGGTNGEVWCMKVYNDNLYIGGSFTHAGGIQVDHLAKWDGSTWSVVTPFRINASIYCMDFLKNDIYIGGNFDSIGNQLIRAIAKYTLTNGIIENANSGVFFSISPNPVSGKLAVQLARPNVILSSIKISNCFGETISSYEITLGEYKKEIDISQLASGIYFITLQNEKSTLCKKFVKE